MNSRRTRWDLDPNRFSSALTEARARGASLLDLTLTNPSDRALGLMDATDSATAALAAAASRRYTPDPQGLMSAREAVCAYHADHGRQVQPDQVFLTVSTSEAYSWVLKLTCDAGDRVLAPRTRYPLFSFLAQLEGVGIQRWDWRAWESSAGTTGACGRFGSVCRAAPWG